MRMRQVVFHAVGAGLLAAAAACGGGGGDSPTGPSGPGSTVGSTGSVGTIGATITITSAGVSPSQVTITAGQSVRFVNNDSRSRNIASDPHPSHTNCPSLANVGLVGGGQTKDSFGFSGAGSCGYHDHNDPDNNSVKGRITIQ